MGLDKVRAAVIGVGNMGKHHVRNYFEVESSELVAIVDLNETLGAELAAKYKCRYYKDYLDMIKAEMPQLVTIAVPTKHHHRVGIDVMNHGIHVLMEKPIATSTEKAKELIECSKRNNVKLMVGHIERFNPGVRKLKEIMDRDELGEITSVIARRVGVFPPQIKDANVIIDLAVHDIDIINWLLGKYPDTVYSSGGRALASDREDYAEIFLRYGNISGYIQVNWITPVKIRNLAITGINGYAELNYITQRLQLFFSRYSKSEDDFGDFVIKFGEPERIDVEVEQKEPLKAEIESFIWSIQNDLPPKVTGEDGLAALEIALKSVRDIAYERY